MSKHLGKKKLKALRRAQKDAARAYWAGRGATEPSSRAGVGAEPVLVDRFLQAYGDLTDATVELYRHLDLDDPRRQQVRDALAHARRAATAVLAEAATARPMDPGTDDLFPTSSSLELVRIASNPPPTPKLPAVVRPVSQRRLPDEASLVRYMKVRRATHRWPDEAWLARYRRDRALPDETWLKRSGRRRRALYDRYA
jgi:hypothetical protein